jgi:type IV secretion system protein VirB10
MVYMLLFALVLQDAGPRNLQVPDNAKVKPPLVVPVGTTIPLALVNSISTKTAKDGDGVYARTTFPITINNEIVIPVGTNIKGKVTQVIRPGRVKGKAELTISFQQIIFPNGNTMPLYATLGSVGDAGTRKGETTIEGESGKGQDAGTVATTSADGAILGGLGSRSVKGAGIGAAAGSAIGAATVLLTRGKDVVLQPGTTLEIVLDRPIEP